MRTLIAVVLLSTAGLIPAGAGDSSVRIVGSASEVTTSNDPGEARCWRAMSLATDGLTGTAVVNNYCAIVGVPVGRVVIDLNCVTIPSGEPDAFWASGTIRFPGHLAGHSAHVGGTFDDPPAFGVRVSGSGAPCATDGVSIRPATAGTFVTT